MRRTGILQLAAVLVSLASGLAGSDELRPSDATLRLTIPLKNERYTLHDWLRESNRALGTRYDLDQIEDREYPFNERRFRLYQLLIRELPAASRPELKRDGNAIVLILPDPEHPEVRRATRELYRDWFGTLPAVWPPELGLKSPRTIDPAARSVVFVHGLEADETAFEHFSTIFRARGIQVFTFSYPSDGPIAEAGDRFRRELAGLHASHPRLKLVLVAHSMGGLVARHALEAEPLPPANVTDLFTVGTPHFGSRMADFHPELELLKQLVPKYDKVAEPLRDGLGEAAVDLRPDSRFLRELNARPRPRGIRYLTACGSSGFVDAERWGSIVDELDRRLKARGVDDLKRTDFIGRLRAARELIDGEGDGAVLLTSARLPRVAASRDFPLNHLDLIDPLYDDAEEHPVADWILHHLGWSRKSP